jgi:hypothetical protein
MFFDSLVGPLLRNVMERRTIMDKTNFADGSLADKIAELTQEQKKALFFGGDQIAYHFFLKSGTQRFCGRGLEGLYCGILTMQRRNSDSDRSNENILKEHMGYLGDDRYLIRYLYDQIAPIPDGTAIKQDLIMILDEIKAAKTSERKIELYNTRFLKYLRDIQPYICPPTYSREEAIRLIKEAVENIPIRSTKYIAQSSLEMRQLEKTAQLFDDKIAPKLWLTPGEPNPSRNITVALPLSNLMLMYFALRYGIRARGLGAMEQPQDYLLTDHLVQGGYLEQGLVDFVYGHDDGYSSETHGDFTYSVDGDIIYFNTRFGDMKDEAGVVGVLHSLMPIGSLLLITPPVEGYYLPGEFDVQQVSMTDEEREGSLWNEPFIIRKQVQGSLERKLGGAGAIGKLYWLL